MSDILDFNADARRKVREPSLSNAELVEIRKMLVEFRELRDDFAKIHYGDRGCPVARNMLRKEL